MKIVSRLYRSLFWHFLKPRLGGSYWSWYPLQKICSKEGHDVRREFANNGWVDKCQVCDEWLHYDLWTIKDPIEGSTMLTRETR